MLVTCTSETASTEISYLGVTLTFSEPVEFGFFDTDGSPWFIGPVPMPTISHAGVTGRNGAMINPSHLSSHGYDNRRGKDAPGYLSYYDASLDVMVNPPATIEPGETLCKAISLNPDLTFFGSGGSATMVDVMAIFTCLATPPAAGAFRPCYAGTDKTMRNRSEVNHALSPNLTKPTGPITSSVATLDFTNVLKSPLYDYGQRSGIRSKIRPQTAFGGDVYPTSAFYVVGSAAAYSMLNGGTPISPNEVRNRLVQHGLDYWANAQATDDMYSNGAGFGSNGALFLILYAGYFLEDEDMLAAGQMTTTVGFPKFGEQYQYYYEPLGWTGYKLPKPYASYTSGIPLFGDSADVPGTEALAENWSERNTATQLECIDELSQPAIMDSHEVTTGSDYYPSYPLFLGSTAHTSESAGTYMHTANRGHAGMLFVCRYLGIDQYFENDATFDYLERMVNDAFNLCTYQGLKSYQVYVFGGATTANYTNFLINMHFNYHGDRATLSAYSVAATGPTTATVTVTTNKSVGKIHYVVSASATKPNPFCVSNGMPATGIVRAAVFGSTAFLTSSGVKTINITGLTPSQTIYVHLVHVGEDASFSAVQTTNSITPS